MTDTYPQGFTEIENITDVTNEDIVVHTVPQGEDIQNETND